MTGIEMKILTDKQTSEITGIKNEVSQQLTFW